MSSSSSSSINNKSMPYLPLQIPSISCCEIPNLRQRYLKRLDIDLSTVAGAIISSGQKGKAQEQDPTANNNIIINTNNGYDFLCQLTEAHLNKIPFENLAQHGGYGGSVQLDPNRIAAKLLDRKRGGFCLELNLLFGILLKDLGYDVKVIPAIVYAGDVGGFRAHPTHILLEVTSNGSVGSDQQRKPSTFLVDVGFGEPSIHPLLYEFNREQQTPEGMKSRVVLLKKNANDENMNEKTDGLVQMQWYQQGEWKPRLQWTYDLIDHNNTSQTTSPTTYFELPTTTREDPRSLLTEMLDKVSDPGSIFSTKMICVRLTRHLKQTLAGHVYKRTGPPRFTNISGSGIGTDSDNNSDSNSEITITQQPLKSLDEIQTLLETEFGIPWKETKTLDIEKLSIQDPNLFGTF